MHRNKSTLSAAQDTTHLRVRELIVSAADNPDSGKSERGPDVPDSDVTADAKRNWIVGVVVFLAEEDGRSERSTT